MSDSVTVVWLNWLVGRLFDLFDWSFDWLSQLIELIHYCWGTYPNYTHLMFDVRGLWMSNPPDRGHFRTLVWWLSTNSCSLVWAFEIPKKPRVFKVFGYSKISFFLNSPKLSKTPRAFQNSPKNNIPKYFLEFWKTRCVFSEFYLKTLQKPYVFWNFTKKIQKNTRFLKVFYQNFKKPRNSPKFKKNVEFSKIPKIFRERKLLKNPRFFWNFKCPN